MLSSLCLILRVAAVLRVHKALEHLDVLLATSPTQYLSAEYCFPCKAGCCFSFQSSVRFNDLRHSFATRMAASGVPLRTLQEWMGHRNFKTTLVYADYAPSEHEAAMAERAFGAGTNPRTNLSASRRNSEQEATPENA